MTAASRRDARFRVEFDDATFTEDLEHTSSDTGRTLAGRERDKLAADRLSPDRLKRCDTEARDGTSLPGCVKIYIPQPNGTWGMVFQLRIDDKGRPFLAYIAFGTRHPTSPGALACTKSRINGYTYSHHGANRAQRAPLGSFSRPHAATDGSAASCRLSPYASWDSFRTPPRV